MKITPPSPNLHPAKPSNSDKKSIRQSDGAQATDAFSDDAPGAVRTEEGARDFASVLRDVSTPRRRDSAEDRDASSNDRNDSQRTEGSEREREAERLDERDDGRGGRDGDGGQMGQRGAAATVRDSAVLGDSTSARAILHIADIERILAAVRTQTLSGGRREVTLELHRSVLEGLRVRLSMDETGRITAEFIASTERVRAQLDARSSELSDILRSRGVNLAQLKTSLGSDSAGQDGESHDRQQSDASIEAASQRLAAGEKLAEQPLSDAGLAEEPNRSDSDSTYRA